MLFRKSLTLEVFQNKGGHGSKCSIRNIMIVLQHRHQMQCIKQLHHTGCTYIYVQLYQCRAYESVPGMMYLFYNV